MSPWPGLLYLGRVLATLPQNNKESDATSGVGSALVLFGARAWVAFLI